MVGSGSRKSVDDTAKGMRTFASGLTRIEPGCGPLDSTKRQTRAYFNIPFLCRISIWRLGVDLPLFLVFVSSFE